MASIIISLYTLIGLLLFGEASSLIFGVNLATPIPLDSLFLNVPCIGNVASP